MNFYLSIIVLCVVLSSTLIIANPDMSSTNGSPTFIRFCSFCFNTMHSFGKISKDLFKKLKQQYYKFITPCNSNILLIPRTRSMLSCISDTKVYNSNLCLYISTINSIMNKTLMNCPFPTGILCVIDANFGRNEVIYRASSMI